LVRRDVSAARVGPNLVVSPTSVAPGGTGRKFGHSRLGTGHRDRATSHATRSAQHCAGYQRGATSGPGGLTPPSCAAQTPIMSRYRLTINGIDVSDPTNPNRSFDFGQLLTTDIAQVEVLRGPQSGLYGANALGGVICGDHQKGDGAPRMTGTKEGGSSARSTKRRARVPPKMLSTTPSISVTSVQPILRDAFAKVDNP
jgi:vitamin B12 transporter